MQLTTAGNVVDSRGIPVNKQNAKFSSTWQSQKNKEVPPKQNFLLGDDPDE
jgi:hypothetical protein